MNRRHQRIHIRLILLSRRVLDGLGPHDVVAHGGRTNRITGFLPYSTLVTAFLANKNIIRVVVFFDNQTEHELVPGRQGHVTAGLHGCTCPLHHDLGQVAAAQELGKFYQKQTRNSLRGIKRKQR